MQTVEEYTHFISVLKSEQISEPNEKEGFYVTVRDGPKTAFLLGPFKNEADCRKYAYSELEDGGNRALHNAVQQICYEVDPKVHFADFGMARTDTTKRTGCLQSMYPHGELEDKIINRLGI
jgi:hypothetical protein